MRVQRRGVQRHDQYGAVYRHLVSQRLDEPEDGQEIVVGDEVLTHKGRVRKVKEVFKHDINAKIHNLKAQGHPTLNVTSEHPLYALAGENVRKKKPNQIVDKNYSFD